MPPKNSQKPIIVRAKDIFVVYGKQVRRHMGLVLAGADGFDRRSSAGLASPLFLKQIFNLIAANHPSPDLVHHLFILVTIIASISIVGWVALRTQVYSIMYLESKSMADLYSYAFDYLIGHSYHFFISQFSGTLTRRVSKFAASFEIMMDSIMLQFFPTAIFVIGAVTILFLRNHVLGIALGIWVICFVSFQLFVAKVRQPLRVARSEADSKMVGSLADAISNQNTIALFSGNIYEHTIFSEVVELWRKATMRSWNADELVWSVQGILMVGINIGLLYGAIIYWQRGLITIGDFILIQSYLLEFFPS